MRFGGGGRRGGRTGCKNLAEQITEEALFLSLSCSFFSRSFRHRKAIRLYHSGSPTPADAGPQFFDRHTQAFGELAECASLRTAAPFEQHRDRGLADPDPFGQLRLRELAFRHQTGKRCGKGGFGLVHLRPQFEVRRSKAFGTAEYPPRPVFATA